MKLITETKIIVEGGDHVNDLAFEAYKLIKDGHDLIEFEINNVKFTVEKN